MKPVYISNFISENKDTIFSELAKLPWLEVTPARKEFFMADNKLSYTYGSGNSARTYESSDYSECVKWIRDKLDLEFKSNYNVCFLNRYDQQKNALNWHSDDSPEMNPEHDICVVSFGAEREIWWKKKISKGKFQKRIDNCLVTDLFS